MKSKARFSSAVEAPVKKALLCLLKTYKYLLSPWLGNHCRFYPTCSDYVSAAISQHGVTKGSYLGLRRLLRCHPWCEGGVDPVPETKGSNTDPP